jgi:hypothetical protein
LGAIVRLLSRRHIDEQIFHMTERANVIALGANADFARAGVASAVPLPIRGTFDEGQTSHFVGTERTARIDVIRFGITRSLLVRAPGATQSSITD